MISDDLTLVVDGTVARLNKRNPQMGGFVWLYFGTKWPTLRIAREHKMSEAKAREPINTGVAWIDCALEQLREAA